MQGSAKIATATKDPWTFPVNSTKTDIFGAIPKQQQQPMNGFSKNAWPGGVTMSSSKEAKSDPWGSTYKNRENFVDMHLF